MTNIVRWSAARPDDRVLILRYLYETRTNVGIDRDQWRRLGPELWSRLLEICPLQPIDPQTETKVSNDAQIATRQRDGLGTARCRPRCLAFGEHSSTKLASPARPWRGHAVTLIW
jgi:hypothetical protein